MAICFCAFAPWLDTKLHFGVQILHVGQRQIPMPGPFFSNQKGVNSIQNPPSGNPTKRGEPSAPKKKSDPRLVHLFGVFELGHGLGALVEELQASSSDGFALRIPSINHLPYGQLAGKRNAGSGYCLVAPSHPLSFLCLLVFSGGFHLTHYKPI